ncbi:ubiquinol-cytochrome C chaperone family protein [Prosthecomicrobium pneumaticum]|uniref:Cytochrome b pre-mRNA-processing protein 3 n=1 Tax=Prosthecomicrobium pneumaticum TaxID=81895 RepID=A0A7W9FQ62_9HYPH|nr:ubiquinol-cytochrome C chaperone family protein [Prosthecomicrobium pneumaticum]MBB5754770.1 cytochrome b pre-mRNA-processing protein 3 [Prosthecomicrobium pneumaticum]
MLNRLFGRARREAAIADGLYGAIVAQARQPALYADFGVPDTIDGRFDMVVLHTFLLFHRLKGEEAPRRRLGQLVFDRFVKDMDRSLRELGVGDLSVPKKLKKMGESFYGRVDAYDAALSAGDHTALMAALARNVWPDFAGATGVGPLARYVEAAAAAIEKQSFERIAAGALDFPAPTSAIAAAEATA